MLAGLGSTARQTIERMLDLMPSVRSLEHMNMAMSESVEPFQETLRPPPRKEEGSILAVAVDGKGVPMRRQDRSGEARGRRANRKREACVAVVYTIEPFVRTAEDLLDDVFRQRRSRERPQPCHKRVRAELSRPRYGQEVKGKELAFRWVGREVSERRARGQPVICLMDGAEALWRMKKRYLRPAVGILDLYHVLQAFVAGGLLLPRGRESGSEGLRRTKAEADAGGRRWSGDRRPEADGDEGSPSRQASC